MVIGYNTETKDIDNELDATLANLRYLCTTPEGFDEAKFDIISCSMISFLVDTIS